MMRKPASRKKRNPRKTDSSTSCLFFSCPLKLSLLML
jgi:hypothetical protein